jgi:hypothetical protein
LSPKVASLLFWGTWLAVTSPQGFPWISALHAVCWPLCFCFIQARW